MKKMLKYVAFVSFLLFAMQATAQNKSWKEMHKVKKKETIYGIAKQYGITEEELRNANPEMKMEGYTLRKGDYIFIPYPQAKVTQPAVNVLPSNVDIRQRSIRMGVMLPLHNENGDGRRMIDYYRGVLMAIDDLRAEGISVDAHAWNLAEDADVESILQDPNAASCDIIFGPLYTKQMDRMSQFTQAHNIRLVVPFSIDGKHVAENEQIFQVYQRQSELDAVAISHFVDRFRSCNIVIVDCNDAKSTKANFMTALRAKMEEAKLSYHITNVSNTDATFVKAFSLDKPNVVVLNTGRSPELNQVLNKLDAMTAANKSISVSLFGYNEWLMYEKYNLEKFYKYDTFIPTYYYYNAASTRTKKMTELYRERFGVEMIASYPSFALTGYDQARFFLRGLHRDGKTFTGESPDKDALQTQYKFVRQGSKGGMKNSQFLFIHYNRSRQITTIVY